MLQLQNILANIVMIIQSQLLIQRYSQYCDHYVLFNYGQFYL